MIALSVALVLVAAIGAFVASRYFAMQLQLAKPNAEHASQLARLEDRVHELEGKADRVVELEYALDASKPELAAQCAALAEQVRTLGAQLDERITKAEQKYDTILKHGINEMREIVKPIDAHYKRMINGRASAALPSKGASNG